MKIPLGSIPSAATGIGRRKKWRRADGEVTGLAPGRRGGRSRLRHAVRNRDPAIAGRTGSTEAGGYAGDRGSSRSMPLQCRATIPLLCSHLQSRESRCASSIRRVPQRSRSRALVRRRRAARDAAAARGRAHREPESGFAAADLARYLTEEIGAAVERLGFDWTLWHNPVAGAPPMLFAERLEDSSLPDGADLRPRRRRRGPRHPVERRPLALERRGRGRSLVRPRHRRQQGPAHDQPRGARQCSSKRAVGSASMRKLLLEMGEEVGSPGLRRRAKRESASLPPTC